MSFYEVVLIFCTVIGLLVGALGTLKSKQKDITIDTLSKDNVATKDYNQTLESENARITAQRDGLQKRTDDLKELAQGSPQLKILTVEFAKFTKAMTAHNKLLTLFIKKLEQTK